MADRFSDFSGLRDLKIALKANEKSQELKEQNAPASGQRRSRTVKLKSRDEERARNEGYAKGQRVRLMDTNDEGEISGFKGELFEITLSGGLVITAVRSEFVVVTREEDLQMYRAMPSSFHKKKVETPSASVSPNTPLTVNLHLEYIPGNENVPEWAARDFQIEYFRRVIRENLRHRGRKIVFIHGHGDGTLRDAVRKELDEVFALSCTYSYGTADNYGSGTVIVTIR